MTNTSPNTVNIKHSKLTSFSLTNAIYSQSIAVKFELNPTELLVLIGLCTHYNPKKQIVFPSQQYLAKHLNVSERSVIRAIKTLVQKNIILKSKHKNNNIYGFTSIFFESVNLSPGKCQNVIQVGDKMSYKHDKKNIKNNIFNFENENAENNESLLRINATKELIENYSNVKKGSPLDFSYNEAKDYLENLPKIMKNSYFACELRKKWNL